MSVFGCGNIFPNMSAGQVTQFKHLHKTELRCYGAGQEHFLKPALGSQHFQAEIKTADI